MKLLTIFLLCICTALYAKPDRSLKQKQEELTILRGYLEAARDSLQEEVAARWRVKQLYVEQREADKEELTILRESQERIHGELARLKEKCFANERRLEDERKKGAAQKDEWDFLNVSLKDVFKNEANTILGVFPTDVEERRKSLEEVRRGYSDASLSVSALKQYSDYRLHYLQKGTSVSFFKKKTVPDTDSSQILSIIRFGNVFAFGMNSSTDFYLFRQTGNLGIEQYSIDRITHSGLLTFLSKQMPGWLENKAINGTLAFDVLQNNQSTILIRGEKADTKSRIASFFKAGGPVLVPLFLLVVWALILTIYKLYQFSKKHTSDLKISLAVLEYIKEDQWEKACDFVRKQKGVVAAVVRICLEHATVNRSAAEKAVKEFLVDELPQLNKHLNTLAVIAGAAPLLGLLGTVTGMINLFKVITHYGTGDPKILAGGISEALTTTMVGLSIAIPVLLIHNFLRNRTLDIQSETEKHAIRILNHLWPES